MTLLKYTAALLFSFTLLIGCQRGAASAGKDSKPDEKTKADEKDNYKREQMHKDLDYKEPSPEKEAMIKQTLKNNPDLTDYKSYYESGYQKHNSGDFQGAISDFSKCISLNPGFSDAYNFRGMSKYKSGDNSGACSDWKKAVELGYSQGQSMIEKYCK